ncbi:MAG: CHAT domain-containing protein [Saprospiraceae bacterium]|nr:CHAT domain-containing protein [Saprospiraceae bacterium]
MSPSRFFCLFSFCFFVTAAIGQDVVEQYEAQFHGDNALREAEDLMDWEHLEKSILLLDDYQQKIALKTAADSLILAKIFQYKALCHAHLGQNEKGLVQVEQSLRIQRTYLPESNGEIGTGLLYLGRIKAAMNEHDVALKCLQKAAEIQLSDAHTRKQGISLDDGFGFYYQAVNQLDKSLAYFERSLSDKKQLKNDRTIWRTWLMMGETFASKNEVQKSKYCYHEALKSIGQQFEGNHVGAGKVYLELSYLIGNYEKEKIDSMLLYAQKAAQIAEKYDTVSVLLADAYSQIGACEGLKMNFKSSEGWILKAKGIFEKLDNISGAARCKAALAIVYFAQSDIDEAEVMATEALAVFTALNDRYNLHKTLLILSIIYRVKGDFEKSDETMEVSKKYSDMSVSDQVFYEQYEVLKTGYTGDFNTGLAIAMKNLQDVVSVYGENSSETISALNDVGQVFLNLGDCDNAAVYISRALEIAQKKPNIPSYLWCDIQLDLSAVYNCKGEYDSAVHVIKNNFPDFISNDTARMASGYYRYIINEKLSWIYLNMMQYDSALHYMLNAIEASSVAGDHFFYTKSFDFVQLGDIYYALNRFDTSLYYYRLAVQSFDDRSGFPTNKLNPNFIYALAGEAKSICQVHPDSLFTAGAILNLAMDYCDELRLTFSDKSKLDFLLVRHYLTEIKLNFLLKTEDPGNKIYQDSFFELMEMNKGIALLELINNEEAMSVAGIPSAAIETCRRYAAIIHEAEKILFESSLQPILPTDSLLIKKSAAFADANLDYAHYLDSLSGAFPQYHKLKYDHSTVSLTYVQDSLLQPDQTLIEFFTGDSAVYIFAVRPDTFAVHQIKRDPGFPLDSLVRQMRYGLTDYHVSQSTLPSYELSTAQAYAQAAHALYEKLIAPVAPLIPKNGKVIIVPDGILGYVPFDALLTSRPENPERYYNHDYFGNNHPISYAYSATLLREMRDKQHKNPPGQPMLALAPFFQGNPDALLTWTDAAAEALGLSGTRDSISALPASGQEIKDVAGPFKGQTWYGAKATIDSFQRHAGQYRILHLSTHGKANDRVGDYAWLAFAQPGDTLGFDKFYVKDIYNLALNADLVTLSACETGIGQLKRGEGIISLARAFAYAGAKSIVTTLWPVNDARTGELMRLFYRNLHKGMDKDTALWQAKKDFIQQHKKDGGAHPYFWSGFIPVGDMRKL